mmetsp:Transcript_13189/g.22598  ORF Transcript_13189/g.22598 Transcript_13189/m.22598 type:complete len:114 (-) Transcript_13189:38-379(-)|eukprot:CAMPEP_0183753134 /NCGR_PEP_ID=MMETSP0739-20130205/2752_1 /TAXON_ID=385413 /ORGANISM="Thalassiosira miniscula, Strain CCMP1093" /LENGTH=113 /DNA_ID=CAMNT_0025989571 /DNA_START=748 /DNA_END=1092 /DNA_ORIENTATION=-
MLDLVFAGHDTTYASISTLLYHLSQTPNAMVALTEEISLLNEPLNSDKMKNNAPVLNAFIYESWKMDPPVPGDYRKAIKDMAFVFKNDSELACTIFFCGLVDLSEVHFRRLIL